LHFYVPAALDASIPDCWGTPAVAHDVLVASIGNAEPRLRMLASIASPASALFYRQHQQLEDEDDWLLPSGVGAVLGDAAHPAPPASIQASAMVFEDAAVFAKLFSHMRRADQAPSLIQAYAGLRAQRVPQVLQGDVSNIDHLTMPYDEGGVAKDRDQGMREATKVGKSALGGDGSDASASKQWEQILSTWGYGTSSLCPN
jgi:salicylate hydroxylase